MNKVDMRQGRHGEALFAEMCQRSNARTDATLNDAAADLHGWDFVIDLCPTANPDIPADLASTHFQCFAQVKTTNGKATKTRVKLSNAIKAARSPSPFFIFLFHYKEKAIHPDLYGIHFWSDEIEEALKNARVHGNSAAKALNKKYVHYTFDDSNLIAENPTDWMMSCIGQHGLHLYSERKIRSSQSVGYDGFPHEGKVIIGPTSITDIVLHEIGVLDSLPFQSFELFDRRFGIKSVLPVGSVNSGRFSIQAQGKPVELYLEHPSGEELTLDANAYSPRSIGLESLDYKVRLEGDFFSAVVALHVRSQSYSLNLDPEVKRALPQQLKLLQLINWCGDGSIRFSLQSDIGELFSGSFDHLPNPPPWTDHLYKTAKLASESLGLEKSSRTLVSLHDIWILAESVSAAAMLCYAGSIKLQIPNSTLPTFEEIIGYIVGNIGNFSFGVLYRFPVGASATEDSGSIVYFRQPEVIKRVSRRRLIGDIESDLVNELSLIIENPRSKIAVVDNGDINQWVSETASKGNLALTIYTPDAE